MRTEPPSGSLVANYEGREINLRCSRFRDGHKSPTQWSRKKTWDSQPSRDGSLLNELIILNLISDLDGMIICCGTEEEPELANFTLRVYRKQKIQYLY